MSAATASLHPATPRERLLGAAERILVEQGAQALTVRRIGTMAGLNGTLVTYHFGSMGQLAAELADRNLQPMQHAWRQIESIAPGSTGEAVAVLRHWLEPLLLPAACNHDGRALLVLDELVAHGADDLRANVMEAMRAIAAAVTRRLQPLAPHLSPSTLNARLRLIAGAALGPPPRDRGYLINADELVAFACAALEIPRQSGL